MCDGRKPRWRVAGRMDGEKNAMTFSFNVMTGRLVSNVDVPESGAVLLTSFPARGLPQSGSKGLSQSKASRLPTPLANAPQVCGAVWILSDAQPLVQQRGGGRVLEQGFFFGAQQGHGTKGG